MFEGCFELKIIFDFIYLGEILVVMWIDWFVCLMQDFQIIVVWLKEKGVYLVVIEQFVDIFMVMGKVFFDMFGVFVEFEINFCCEWQVEGIKVVKCKGVYCGCLFKIDMVIIQVKFGVGFFLMEIVCEMGILCGIVYKVKVEMLMGNDIVEGWIV